MIWQHYNSKKPRIIMEAVAGQDTSIAAHCKTAVFQPGQGDLF